MVLRNPIGPWGPRDVGWNHLPCRESQRIAKGEAVLLLSAGDMMQGNAWANLFQGESVIETDEHHAF